MRQIKFRAWVPEKNSMMMEGSLEFWFITIAESGINPFERCPKMIPLQFTGLLDKNGKEIYEGDIVLNHFRNQKLVVFWDTKIIGTKGGGWNYKKLENDKEMTWKIEPENIEIIGNIYENPELLKRNENQR